MEVLLALVLMGLIAVMISTGLQQSQQVFSNTALMRGGQRAVLDVQQQVSRWLSSSQPYDPARAPLAMVEPLSGNVSEVTFSAPLDPTPLHNDLYRVRLWRDASTAQLRMGFAPDRDGYELGTVNDGITLLEGVSSLQFEFLDAGAGLGNFSWRADWQGRSTLPIALRMTVSFADDRRWPQLFIPLAINGREYCAFDPVSRRCR